MNPKLPDVRQVELHFRIGPAAVGVVAVRVVAGSVAQDAVEDREGGVFARGDDHLSDVELHGFEHEVHAVEDSGRDRACAGGVADHRGLDAAHRVAGFERVDALFVGGDADGRPGEHDAHEPQRHTVSVGHLTADAGALRLCSDNSGEERQNPEDHSPYHDGTNVRKKNRSGENKLPLRENSR